MSDTPLPSRPTAPWLAYQNNKDGVILAVFKQPGANVIDTVDKSRRQLPQLTARIPPAVKVETILDRTVTIRASVADVEFTLVLTIGLVVMVILLFLRNFWATLIPSVTVPLALAGSFAAMYLMHFSLDNLSLMALTISVGFVVDDAIVVVENILSPRRRWRVAVRRRRSGVRARSASRCCRFPAR